MARYLYEDGRVMEAFELLQKAHSIVLATHVNPDADTLGSALGVYDILQRMQKRVVVVNTSTLPYNLDFLPGIEKIKKELPQRFDLLISFDCGSFDRLGIPKPINPIINIDHHRSNTHYGDYNIVDPDAASTSEVAYRFFKDNGIAPTKNAAICFYTALVDDTGFFKYDTVRASTFSFAKELCEYGAKPDWIAAMLTMREPLAKLRLLPLVLETLKLFIDGRVAVLRVTQQMLQKSGGTKEMADDALTMARSLATVEVALLMREEENGDIKVSLRSKSYVDVSKIASIFGGGGHRRAAGFTAASTNFDELLKKLLEILKKEIRH